MQQTKHLKNYLHLYIGCQCLITERLQLGQGTNWRVETLVAEHLVLPEEKYHILPILKKFEELENLADEQYKELEIIFDDTFDAYSFIQVLQRNSKRFNGSIGFYELAEAINWLRRNGFDADNLIQYGLALPWTKPATEEADGCDVRCELKYLRENDGCVPCCKTWRNFYPTTETEKEKK